LMLWRERSLNSGSNFLIRKGNYNERISQSTME
jgi:hypothetical protein